MATIRDVAKQSGVSVATVSYVMNNGPRPVRAQTRARVLEAVANLRYRPNAVARGLLSSRMNVLGVAVGAVPIHLASLTQSYVAAILDGVVSECADAGFNLTLFTKPWRDGDARTANAFADRRNDGILFIAPPLDADIVRATAETGVPTVAVSFPGESLNVPSVDTDDDAGMRLLLEYLAGLGHRRIAYLHGNAHRYASARQRLDAFCGIAAELGLAVPPEYLANAEFSFEQSAEPTHRLLDLPVPPTAIIGGNDMTALAALDAARERGLSVPRDLSIVGYDDIPLAALSSPPLTTVSQPLDAIGRAATRLLIALVNGETVSPEPRRLTPTLVVRETATTPPV